jgi:hypothetical protein
MYLNPTYTYYRAPEKNERTLFNIDISCRGHSVAKWLIEEWIKFFSTTTDRPVRVIGPCCVEMVPLLRMCPESTFVGYGFANKSTVHVSDMDFEMSKVILVSVRNFTIPLPWLCIQTPSLKLVAKQKDKPFYTSDLVFENGHVKELDLTQYQQVINSIHPFPNATTLRLGSFISYSNVYTKVRRLFVSNMDFFQYKWVLAISGKLDYFETTVMCEGDERDAIVHPQSKDYNIVFDFAHSSNYHIQTEGTVTLSELVR